MIKKNKIINSLVLILIGFALGALIFNYVIPRKSFRIPYYTFGKLNIVSGKSLVCSTKTESDFFSFNHKFHTSQSKKSTSTKISFGVNLEEKKLSIITDAAVASGSSEPDKYPIISYIPDVSLTAVGQSGMSTVVVTFDIPDSTFVIAKAADFMGTSGAIMAGTCY